MHGWDERSTTAHARLITYQLVYLRISCLYYVCMYVSLRLIYHLITLYSIVYSGFETANIIQSCQDYIQAFPIQAFPIQAIQHYKTRRFET